MHTLYENYMKTRTLLCSWTKLLLEIQLLESRIVALLVIVLEVFQMCSTICNHLQETASAVNVLRVLAEMSGKLVNALGKQGNLDLR